LNFSHILIGEPLSTPLLGSPFGHDFTILWDYSFDLPPILRCGNTDALF
jgi:hypothetical protein